jgi:hypothetical protein
MLKYTILILAGVVGASRSTEGASRDRYNGFDVGNASIPVEKILRGGPARDGIPAIDNPAFINPQDASFMRDDDEVVSLTINGETRAYPLRILVWHEIVNDTVAGRPVAVTYCPLCGTAMVFSRTVGTNTLDFGVSGLLYQSDVLMYDRQTESLWSQLAMTAVSGPAVNSKLQWLSSRQLTWAAWKDTFPGGRVLSTQTGFQRDYAGAGYARYHQSPDTMFPVSQHRSELPDKEWVIGVIAGGVASAYPLRELPQDGQILDVVNGRQIELRYHSDSRMAEVRWCKSGDILPVVKVYWFAWQAFYPETKLWRNEQ